MVSMAVKNNVVVTFFDKISVQLSTLYINLSAHFEENVQYAIFETTVTPFNSKHRQRLDLVYFFATSARRLLFVHFYAFYRAFTFALSSPRKSLSNASRHYSFELPSLLTQLLFRVEWKEFSGMMYSTVSRRHNINHAWYTCILPRALITNSTF